MLLIINVLAFYEKNETWTTFYLINAYEINPNMNKDEILDFLNNQQD